MSGADPSMAGVLAPGKRAAYVLAGAAVVTVRSPSGARFTYRVRRDPDAQPTKRRPWFVSVLAGPDNGASYQYIGLLPGLSEDLVPTGGLLRTKGSRVGPEAPSFKAAAWWFARLEDPRVEVWHEGACGRCGRRLTVPESLSSGLGPTCQGRV